MNSQATAKWIALALLGLAIAALVAIAASNLVSRQIGIASESVSAGDALAPAVESAARRQNVAADARGTGGTGPQDAPGSTPTESPGGGAEATAPTEASPPATESADEREDRVKAEEDAREDALKAQEDAADEAEDAREDALKEREDSSGSGSDD